MPSLLHGQAEAGRHRRAHRPLRASLRQALQEGLGLTDPAIDPQRRSQLLGAQLRALVADELGAQGADPADLEVVGLAGAAAARSGETVWFLAVDDPVRALGPALAWAQQRPVVTLNVLAGSDAEVLARRAELFEPGPVVWKVDGRDRSRAEPAPPPPPLAPPAEALEHVGLLIDAGVEVVIEHGEVAGELLGLEVARVVVDPEGRSRLEVGVGHHDREAFALVHGDVPTPQALRSVVESVRKHRHAGAGSHPLARLAPERWMRSVLISDPDRLGLADLGLSEMEPVESTVPRASLKDPAPAMARAIGPDGPVLVACSSGVDLDLVPVAADTRAARAPDARLILVVPTRDAHPATRRLSESLRDPAALVTVERDWRI